MKERYMWGEIKKMTAGFEPVTVLSSLFLSECSDYSPPDQPANSSKVYFYAKNYMLEA